MLEQEIEKIISVLEKSAKIIITAHDRPDGDALGAVLGLTRVLQALGKETRVIGCQPIPEIYRFLLCGQTFLEPGAKLCNSESVLVALDCGMPERSACITEWLAAGGKVINIDHHKSNNNFGFHNWVEANASSSAEMVVTLCQKAEWEINKEAAEALWVGIITDTGCFTYENTSAKALDCASHLVKCGIKPAALSKHLFRSQPLSSVKLAAKVLDTLEIFAEGQIACLSLQLQDLQESNCKAEDTGDLIDYARNIKGVKIALLFFENELGKNTKVSIRTSDDFDAILLAKSFAGGGHSRAAGCQIAANLEITQTKIFSTIDRLWQHELKKRNNK